MSSAPVHLKGSTNFTRTQRGRRITLTHDTEIALEPNRAALRFTSPETGRSEVIPIFDRGAIYALQEADAAMVRTARKTEEVEPKFKDPKRKKVSGEWAPPDGYMFCPACLGCPELSQICPTCDGERIVKVTIDDE